MFFRFYEKIVAWNFSDFCINLQYYKGLKLSQIISFGKIFFWGFRVNRWLEMGRKWSFSSLLKIVFMECFWFFAWNNCIIEDFDLLDVDRINDRIRENLLICNMSFNQYQLFFWSCFTLSYSSIQTCNWLQWFSLEKSCALFWVGYCLGFLWAEIV